MILPRKYLLQSVVEAKELVSLIRGFFRIEVSFVLRDG
jgi:hypothetical protein